ncbi:MAG: hypothetical protein ACYCT9_00505 [Leptospirillum sp.]|jgi:hypothetical protein
MNNFTKKVLLECIQCFWMVFCGVWIGISELLSLALKIKIPRPTDAPPPLPNFFQSKAERDQSTKYWMHAQAGEDKKRREAFVREQERKNKAALVAANAAAMKKDMNPK